MKPIFLFVAILLLFIFSSCNDKKVDSYVAEMLTEENMPDIQYLDAEEIKIPDGIYLQARHFVYKDTTLLIIHDRNTNPTLLTMMNLRTNEILGDYYPMGEGPEEMLGIYGFIDHNCLRITDYPTMRVSVFNIDSALVKREKYRPIIISQRENWRHFCCLTDSTLLAYNLWYAEDVGEYDTKEFTPEFIVSDMYGNQDEVNIPDHRYFNTFAGALIVANEVKNRIFCAYSRWPKYKLLDYEMNELRRIYGPDDHTKIEYGSIDGSNLAVFGAHSYNAYIASNADYIFVYNQRSTDLPTEEQMKRYKTRSSALDEMAIEKGELYQFDWDGNIIGRYKVKGNTFFSMSISEDSKTIYFTGVNEEREMCLYKISLS